MAQILTHPNAIAAQNRIAATSTLDAPRDPGAQITHMAQYVERLQLAELLVDWATTVNSACLAGKIIFSDDGLKTMQHIIELTAKTQTMMGK